MERGIEGPSDIVLWYFSRAIIRESIALTVASQLMHVSKGLLLKRTVQKLWLPVYEHAFAADIDARRRYQRSRRRHVHRA